MGLGYRDDFEPVCNVHDFGYRNLKVHERTEANKEITDKVFFSNLKEYVCDNESVFKRPACYAAAFAYYQAVKNFGHGSFE